MGDAERRQRRRLKEKSVRVEGVTDEKSCLVLVVLYQELSQHAYAAALGLIHGGDRSDDRVFQEPATQKDLSPRFLQLAKTKQKSQPLLKYTRLKHISLTRFQITTKIEMAHKVPIKKFRGKKVYRFFFVC